MAYQALDLTPGAGDTGIAGGGKINANFVEIYARRVTSASAPTVNDDNTLNYAVGTLWFNTTNNVTYQAISVGTGAAVWLALPNPHPGYVAGRYYANAQRGGAPNAAIATATGTVYYSPLYLSRKMTFDQIAVRTGSANATSGSLFLGIYASTVTGLPGAKLYTVNATSVAIAGTANTLVLAVPDAGTITLSPGLYWVAMLFVFGAPTMTGDNNVSWLHWQYGTTNTSAIFAATSLVLGYTEAGASLPATATPVATTSLIATAACRAA